MEINPDNTDKGPKSPRPSRPFKRLLITLLVVALVLAGVAYMLPIWASTPQGRAYVLEHLNKKLHGKLLVSNWQLGWFSGIKMEGVALETPDGRRVVECASLQTELTLWSWMWGKYDLGNTLINTPQITARRYPDGSNDISRIFANPSAKSPPNNSQNWEALGDLSSLRGAITIDHGELLLKAATTDKEIHLTGVFAQIPIAGASTPIAFSLRARSLSGKDSKPINIEGKLRSLINWEDSPASELRDLEITAGAIPVAPLAEWLGYDSQWENALGESLDEFVFINHPAVGSSTSSPTLRLRGAKGSIEAKVFMQNTNGHVVLTLPNSRDYYAHATLTLARPVRELLGYVNPLLTQTRINSGDATLELTTAEIDLRQPAKASATGILTLRGIELETGGFLKDIFSRQQGGMTVLPSWLTTSGTTGSRFVEAQIPPVRLSLENQRLSCDSLIMNLQNQPRLTFTGDVKLNGDVKMMVTLTGSTPGSLGGATIQLPLRGNLKAIIVERK